MSKIKLSEFDLSLLRKIEDIYSFLLESGVVKSSQDFLEELAALLGKTLEVDYVQIDRLSSDLHLAKTIVAYHNGTFEGNPNYQLVASPFGKTINDKVCCIGGNILEIFPDDPVLQKLKAEGFAGITIVGSGGQPIGIISVLSRGSISNCSFTESVLKLVSIRAAVEIEKMLFAIESHRKDERLQAIIKSSIDGFWITDCSGCFLEVNDTYCQMCGYTSEELLKMNISDLESAESIEETKMHIQRIKDLGADRFESKHRRKDGTVLHVEIGVQYYAADGGSLIAFLHDITDRKKAEAKLMESNDKFKNLVQNMSVGVLLQGPQTEILLSNHKALELLGLTEDQILGKTSFDPDWGVIHEDGSDFPGSAHPVSQAIASGNPVRNVVMGVYRPNPGDRIWLQVDAEPQFDGEKRVSEVICTFIDITKRKHAEQSLNQLNEKLENIVKERTNELVNLNAELQVAQKKYRTVADYTNDWETWMGTDGNYIYVSPYCMLVTGYSADEFINDPGLFLQIVHPDDRALLTDHHDEEITRNVLSGAMDFRIVHKSGEERWIGHRCQAVFDSEGEWIGQRSSNRDITEQKNAEKAMIILQKQLRALSKKTDAIAEEERIRIAREIHDELGHLLTALKFDIESTTEKSDFTADSFQSEMASIISIVDALIDSVRKIASELRPGILDHLGLFPAIEWQINQFQIRTRIKCHYVLDADVSFDKNETTIIYRILQEILTNVARHSKAGNLRITLVKLEDLFCMNVMDDGIGFEWNSEIYRNSFGLMGMRERAMSIGGELDIESFLGQGTTVTLSLKIKQEAL